MHAEQPVGIGPYGAGAESGARRHLAEGFDGVFVAVLGMDRLALREFETLAAQVHALALKADQVHLDAMGGRIVGRIMGKAVQIEVRGQFANGPRQQVLETRR